LWCFVDVDVVRLSLQLTELPFRLASTVTVWLLVMAVVNTENLPLVYPPDNDTEDGTIIGALLAKLMSTVDPLLGAAPDSVSVHTPYAFGPSVVGLHASLLTVGEAAGGGGGGGRGANWRAKLCELPFNVATNVAVVEALTAPIVALNAEVVAPWAMVTDPGVLTLAVLPDTARPTLRPPLGAAADVVTVHDTLPGVVRGLGEQDSAFNVTGGGGGGANWRAKLCELPFNVATNVAVVEALTAPIVALNAEVVAP